MKNKIKMQKRLSVSMPTEMYLDLTALAVEHKCSIADVIRYATMLYICAEVVKTEINKKEEK